MDVELGERLLGKIKKIGSNSILVYLRDDIEGIASKKSLEEIEEEELSPGTEVYVTIQDYANRGRFKVRIDEIIDEDYFEGDVDHFINGMQPESIKKKYGNRNPKEPAKELQKWFREAETQVKKLRKNRDERLDEDFYMVS